MLRKGTYRRPHRLAQVVPLNFRYNGAPLPLSSIKPRTLSSMFRLRDQLRNL